MFKILREDIQTKFIKFQQQKNVRSKSFYSKFHAIMISQDCTLVIQNEKVFSEGGI